MTELIYMTEQEFYERFSFLDKKQDHIIIKINAHQGVTVFYYSYTPSFFINIDTSFASLMYDLVHNSWHTLKFDTTIFDDAIIILHHRKSSFEVQNDQG